MPDKIETTVDVREPEPLARPEEEAARAVSSLIRAGISLTRIPLILLPKESRTHVDAAGRELLLGAAALVRTVANSLDGLAAEIKTQA